MTGEAGAKEEVSYWGGRRHKAGGFFILVCLQKGRDRRNRNKYQGEYGSDLCWDAPGNEEKPAEPLQKRKYPDQYLIKQWVSASQPELEVLTSSCSCLKNLPSQHSVLFLLALRKSPPVSQGLLLCPFSELLSLSSNFLSSALSKASVPRALLDEPSLVLKSLSLPQLLCRPLLMDGWKLVLTHCSICGDVRFPLCWSRKARLEIPVCSG